jgi:hypothetical protein
MFVKLYVCYGTWTAGAQVHRHPCGEAHKALARAGHKPKVVLCYGWGVLPDALNFTPGRQKVKELTGNCWVPVLVLDDETVIQGSRKIADWARDNPAVAENGAGGPNGDAAATTAAGEGDAAATSAAGESDAAATSAAGESDAAATGDG